MLAAYFQSTKGYIEWLFTGDTKSDKDAQDRAFIQNFFLQRFGDGNLAKNTTEIPKDDDKVIEKVSQDSPLQYSLAMRGSALGLLWIFSPTLFGALAGVSAVKLLERTGVIGDTLELSLPVAFLNLNVSLTQPGKEVTYPLGERTRAIVKRSLSVLSVATALSCWAFSISLANQMRGALLGVLITKLYEGASLSIGNISVLGWISGGVRLHGHSIKDATKSHNPQNTDRNQVSLDIRQNYGWIVQKAIQLAQAIY